MTDDALSEEIAAKAQIVKDVLGAKLPAVEVKAKTTVQGGVPGPISWVEQKRSATDPAVIGDLRETARALDELAKRPVEVMVDGTNLVSRADPPTS